MTRPLRALVFAVAVVCPSAAVASGAFDHAAHARVVPRCVSCHPGIEDPTLSAMPSPRSCRSCHDGHVRDPVDWSAPTPVAGSLRFDHAAHRADVRAVDDDPLACAACHAWEAATQTAAAALVRADATRCFDCHGGDHLAAATQCAACHRPLSEAPGLSRADVAAFSRPDWHDTADFATTGHGALCPRDGSSSSCAVCHASQFCASCHVDGPENAAIVALGDDERSLALEASLAAPLDHASAAFLATHGHGASAAACATCHTQESCTICHVATPGVASALHASSPERGLGARVVRRKPASHDDWFRESHGFEASANPANCAACHAREECLDCHLPGAAEAGERYHDLGFFTRHPSAAYNRETSCADCHNPMSFCASCHESSGLVSTRNRLGAGYHDGQESFLFGHGPAARRSLESCVSCHTEADCMACHAGAIVGGRGFIPHGPGFDADRLRERAPQMCTVCHGAAIPGGSRY